MADQSLIELARDGKDAWNAKWEAEAEEGQWSDEVWFLEDGSPLNFTGEDLAGIDFQEFRFLLSVDFTGAKFLIEDPVGYGEANFRKAEFLKGVTFPRFSSELDAIFAKATFSNGANFAGATFSGEADFTGATFSDRANFTGATFSGKADFTGATFSDGADFTGATFSSEADFTGGLFSKKVYFNEASFREEVNFSNRKFEGPTYFHDVTFPKVPLFYGASIHQGTVFGDIDESFTDFLSNGAEQAYRTLKFAMGEQQARTEEAAFAALELKARRHRLLPEAKSKKKSEAKQKKDGSQRFLRWAERCSYWLWEKLSDSGRSFFRPFVSYLAFWLAFTVPYVLPCQGWFGDWWAGLRYSFLKQSSFGAAFRGSSGRIGTLEEKLFCFNGAGLPPWWVDALNFLQAIIAVVLIFLMVFGIRHKFRLRR